MCCFGWDDGTQLIGLGLEYTTYEGPLVCVVDVAPEPRYPTPAGAVSTGPPVPTGADTAIVAVHGLGGALDRVRCRGTLTLQDISIVLTVVPISGFSVHKQNRKNVLDGNSHEVHFHRVRTTCGDILARSDRYKTQQALASDLFPRYVLFLEF